MNGKSTEFTPSEEFVKRIGGTEPILWRVEGDDGKAYNWSIRNHRLELELLQIKGSPRQNPVAIYHRPKRYFFVGMVSQFGHIDIDSSTMGTLDSLIVSFLIMERKRRDGSFLG
ncbi:hypothetical protein SERLA73DRAFT_186085 [Serpula lacrymans var. lacrymans S7.3]|uniref:DUF6593 domain-containing protein n=2 Tax=Serpula lacrymans var. lacrymans TaxID=341189 RepID=F8Q6X5_SERL3|nr:uncharacterized protein SERLADRAFT_474944 [Serpula lacrymans var. lacrymans S7.9]EGN96363.1 hypothetical protein SERLA73DRAFT_186085 [Serpula lacrymans var. lacrymans S7.3]EGO21902.1 hypothetical protein SERLADRAFT_474944 [Serpula lacrymans var. lacrymans S7.9]